MPSMSSTGLARDCRATLNEWRITSTLNCSYRGTRTVSQHCPDSPNAKEENNAQSSGHRGRGEACQGPSGLTLPFHSLLLPKMASSFSSEKIIPFEHLWIFHINILLRRKQCFVSHMSAALELSGLSNRRISF